MTFPFLREFALCIRASSFFLPREPGLRAGKSDVLHDEHDERYARRRIDTTTSSNILEKSSLFEANRATASANLEKKVSKNGIIDATVSKKVSKKCQKTGSRFQSARISLPIENLSQKTTFF